MGVITKLSGLGTCQIVWKAFRKDFPPPSGQWFGNQFLTAATIVVKRWGPKWSRRRFVTEAPIGAWLLLVIWVSLPAIIIAIIW